MGKFDLMVFLEMIDRVSGPIQRPMRALEALERQAHRVERGTRQMLDGAAVTAAGGAVIAPLVVATNAASDLSESISKSNVVFGQNQAVITAWSRNSARDFGLTRQAAYESAATLGNLFVSMRIGSRSAATMSTRLVGLAGDLASFNNTSVQDAYEAIRSGLVGETEPLRRFGVNMDEQSLKLKAFQLGLTKKVNVATLPPAVKAMAAYSLVFEQTKTAQGDFARTQSGLANSTRILQAQMGDAWATIGQHVLPVATGLMHVASGLLSRFNRFAQDHPTVAKVLILTAAAIGGLLVVGGSLLVLLGLLNVAWGNAVGGLALLRGGLARTSAWLTTTALGYYRNLVAVGAWTTANSAAQYANLRQVTGLAAVRLALAGAQVQLIGAATAAWGFTVALLANPVTWIVLGVVALGAALYGLFRIFPRLTKIVTGAFRAVVYAVGYALGFIGGLFVRVFKGPITFLFRLHVQMLQLGFRLIQGLVLGIWNGAKAVWKAITGVASGALDRFRKFFGIRSPSRVFAGLGENLLDGLTGGMERRAPSVFRFLSDKLGPRMLQSIRGGWSRVRTFGGNLLNGARNFLGLGGAGGAQAPANTATTAGRFSLSGITGNGTGAQLARAAVQGITAGWAESIPGYCSRFVRQVFGKVLGPQTARLFSSSALNTEKVWKAQGLTRTLAEIGGKAALRAGDVLFQGFGSGGYGHTGMYIGNGMVAQNTTAAGGGKKILPLSAFGAITSVGRLPIVPPAPRAAPRPPTVPAPPRPQGQATPKETRPVHIGQIVLPNVTKPDEFVAGLRQVVEAHQ